MSLRSRLAEPPVPVAKVFSPGTPDDIAASEAQQQMTPASPFSPGTPIGPYDGYSRTPRVRDYVTGYNIATRPRLHERVSFDTLKGLIGSYDVAGIAIWHRIDSLRSVKYRLNAADGYSGDVSGAVDIAAGVLRKPDGKHHFKTWFGKWMWDVLAYDAGTLYRMRNRAGRCVGLMPVDGTTVAPLLDYWGNEPEPPAESHVQYANGLPWNWLTRDDLIYEPMRAVNDSIYGHAPIETIMLNANTDIRFQLHFLQRFTEGNIPAAFASAPESWTPDQIEQFQELWDSFMYGDQTRKSQIRWLPGGSTFTWTNEKDFTDQFSLFMMRKTCACFHVVPTDLGFTDSSNYSTGESQADVAHKVGELPLMEYCEEILSQFLYDDLGLPLKFEFDRGEDQDDRLVQAQADEIYIQNAVVGTEEIREMRYGLPKSGRPVPRLFLTERGGPVPLNAIMAVAGEIDPETGAPAADAVLPHDAFSEIEGVESNPPVVGTPLAVQEYGPSALPPMPPQQPMPPGSPAPTAKEAAGGDGAGITSDTGIYGDPLERDEDEDEDERAELAKAELAAFRRFERARRRAGSWRDFRFEHTVPGTARALNAAGRAAIHPAPVAKGVVKTKADEVFHQLSEDYPKSSLEWVHQAVWEGPLIVPFSELNMSDQDGWRASHEPDRVQQFADRIKRRTGTGKSQLKKPAVVIYEPGAKKALIVDGHHRTLGAQRAGEEGVLAWVGHVASKDGPWMELHNLQFTDAEGSGHGSGDDVAASQVGKAASGYSLNPRSGMISLDLPEGTIEPIPGGVDDHHITVVYLGPDVDDEAFAAACQRAQAAASAMAGPLPGTISGTGAFPASASSDGKVPAWAAVAIPGSGQLREALADLSASEHADWVPHVTLAYLDQGDPLPAPLPETPVTFTHLSVHRGDQVAQFPLGGEPVAKAVSADPKALAWAGWRLTDKAVAYWAPLLTAATVKVLTPARLNQAAADYLAARPQQQGDAPGKKDRNDAAYAWLVAWLSAHGVTLDASGLAGGILADGYLIGSVSAAAAVAGGSADLGGWKPGGTAAVTASVGDLGGADALAAYLAAQAGATAERLTGVIVAAVSRELAGADGDSDPKALGGTLAATVADGALAAGEVFAVLCEATAAAADGFYRGGSVPGLDLRDFAWVIDPTLKNCVICVGNMDAAPRPYGTAWPSGDIAPGIHLKCGCALIPA